MKIASAAARWLFVLCMPLLLISASIAVAINSAWLYRYGFVRYGVSDTTGLSLSELEKAADGLVRYFNSGEEYVDITVVKNGKPMPLFNQREIGHLKDVKDLFRLDYRVVLLTGLYAFAYVLVGLLIFKRRRQVAQNLLRGSVLTLAVMAAAGAGALLDFDRVFLQFHLLSFSNDLWQLDPATDYLIMLFPQSFWSDTALFCVLSAALLAAVIGGASLAYLRVNRDRGQSSGG